MATFGQRLKSLREDRGLNQIELAKKLSVANSTISQYEAGRRTPDYTMIKRLTEYFNVSMGYLMGLSDDPNPDKRTIKSTALTPELQELLGHARQLDKAQVKQLNDFLSSFLGKEPSAPYHSDLDSLLPLNEAGIGQAMIKIADIAHIHKLNQEEMVYLLGAAIEHYGKPTPATQDYLSAHGPDIPGQIKVKRKRKDKTNDR